MAIIYQVEGIWGKTWKRWEAMLYWEKSIQREHSLCNNPEPGACGLIHRVFHHGNQCGWSIMKEKKSISRWCQRNKGEEADYGERAL